MFDIKKLIFPIIINVITIIMFTNCGYKFCTDIVEKNMYTIYNVRSIELYSYDPFGPVTLAIITELYKNKVDVLNELNNDLHEQKIKIPCLHIINVTEKHITTSVFQNGRESGYQLVLHVKAKLLIPNKDCCPISVRVHRSFIRNPDHALFNDTQENDVRKTMYRDAAQKLVYQLFLLCKIF